IVETNQLQVLEEAKRRVPAELVEFAELPGLGPKRVKILHDQLGVRTLQDLEAAARSGKIQELAGFGVKTQERILDAILQRGSGTKRVLLAAAEEVAEPFLAYLTEGKGVHKAMVAGSYRRRKETIGDLDILITCDNAEAMMDRFVRYEPVVHVVSKGHTRSTVQLRSGLQVDLRVVPDESYGAALQYFTGSQAHNIAVRSLAGKLGLKINEYGVFRGDRRVAGRTEEEVYHSLGLSYIEPELRENWGEIEASQRGDLPRLVTLADIRGDLHCHSLASDGSASIQDLAHAAQAKGYEYLAITDHTQRVTIANGLDAKRLAQQLDEIDRLNAQFQGFRILKSAEVDILEDGSLDLPTSILQRLDITVCSIHYQFHLSKTKQTERVIRAMDNPYFHIWGHPTGRFLSKRDPYDIDMERVLEAARERGCFLEVNAQPVRLDLSDVHCKMAKDFGIKVAISSDAHRLSDLDLMRFGIGQARRGWLEPQDVLNTRSWPELKTLLKRV
ncbi:MAG: DNA polymerase/3'-5' exonuclease PolX, partial [Nitrospirae bacterium]